jgi:hypothetical protein
VFRAIFLNPIFLIFFIAYASLNVLVLSGLAIHSALLSIVPLSVIFIRIYIGRSPRGILIEIVTMVLYAPLVLIIIVVSDTVDLKALNVVLFLSIMYLMITLRKEVDEDV